MRLVKITILEFPRQRYLCEIASGSPGSDRSVSHIYCFIIEVSCLVIYCCITHYSQRRYISLAVSYTEAIMPYYTGHNQEDIPGSFPVLKEINRLLLKYVAL